LRLILNKSWYEYMDIFLIGQFDKTLIFIMRVLVVK
jgi:hypothetical protein